MALYEINLKVYVNYDGTLYNKGSKNVLRPIYKLSNAVYKLSLITPIAPTNVLYASFQKADGTKTTQQLMAYDGIEVVDGNNWNVYTLNINNSITNVSEKQRDNSLSFDFNVSDGKSTPALLNTEPIVVKCQYSIIGQEVEISQSDLDQILASVMATLKNRDKDKVFSVTFLPSVVEDETDDNYNVGYVYLLNGKYTAITEIPETPDPNVAYLWNGETRTTAPILVNGKYYRFKDSAWQELTNFSQNKGNIYRAVKGGYAEIARGIEYINTLMTDVENIKNALGDTSQIPSGSTITALVLQNVSDITKLKNDVLDLGALIEQNQNQISTINQSIESINNELGSLSQRLTSAENDIVTLTNSLNQIGSSVMENTDNIASLQGSKLNKDFSDIAIGNTIADNDYVVVNSGGVSYKIVFSKLKELVGGGGGVNHYKGDFISYEALVQAVPVGEPGDYAFVNTDNELVMYIWDSDDNTWKETTHGQYVSTATFAEFQQGLITNGTIVANTASNYYTANGNKNIESEFNNVRTSIQETKAKIPTNLTDGNIENIGINLTDDNGDSIGTGFGFGTINDQNILVNGNNTSGGFYLMEEINLSQYVLANLTDQSKWTDIESKIIPYFRSENVTDDPSGTIDNYEYDGEKQSGCLLTLLDGAYWLTSRDYNSSTQVGKYTFRSIQLNYSNINQPAIVLTIDFSVKGKATLTDVTTATTFVWLPYSITITPADATSGTLSENNYSSLSNNHSCLIRLNNEYYYLCSNGKTDDTLVYGNIDYENTQKVNKFIVITKSTRAWVLVQTEDTPTSQGFVDATDLIPSGGNLYSNDTLGAWLDACAEKGYKMVYAFQDFNESGKDNNVVYAIANLPPYNSTKPDWMCWFFRGATGNNTYRGTVYYKPREGLESLKFNWKAYDNLVYSYGGTRSNVVGLWSSVSRESYTSSFSSSSYQYFGLDMFYELVQINADITSAITTIGTIRNFNLARKIFLSTSSNLTINGKAILSNGTLLYTSETKSNFSPSSQTFTGGILRDADENEYEVSIRTPYTGTTTYTLYIIQKVVKITGLPETATNGTFTDYEISTLQNGTKYIEFNNELYELNDKQHTSGYLTFSHLGAENSKHMTKCITVTISAKTWVLTTQEVMPVIANPTGDATANLTKVQIGDVIYSIPSGGGGSTELMVSTTYANLVSLKTNSQLQKGVLYRITDYTATTSQPYTRETTNQFDVLVRATSENTLDENANAILHSGDTYFANCKLENWVLKYCLTNDSSRFYWADTSSGKGVVYYLRDEWGNEAPYDFKNIQFELYKITACPNVPGLVGKYTFSTDNAAITTNNTDSLWTYTFGAYVTSETKMYDMSVEQSKWGNDEGGYNNTCENKIGEYHGPDHSYGPLVLNKTAFLYMNPEADDFFPPQYNTIGANNYENLFNGYNCMNNIIGVDFTRNTLLGETTHLHVGIGCYFLVSDSYMMNVKFKLNCSNVYLSNIIMSSCSFGVSCSNDVFSGNGNAVSDFTLEDNCSNLSLTIPSGQNGPLSRVYVEAGTSGFLSSAIAKVDIYDSQMVNNESPITISRDSNDKLLMIWQSDGRTQGCKTKSATSYTNWTATDDSAKPYATKEYVDSHSGSKEVVSKAITGASDIANVEFTAEEFAKLKSGAELVFTYSTVTYLTERIMNLLPNPLVNVDNIFYKLHQVNFDEDTDRVYEGYIYVVPNSDGTAGVTKVVYLATPLRYSYSSISVDSWVESTEVSGYGYSLTLDYSGIRPETFVNVYFSVADASSGNFAPFVKTSYDQFTIYAKTKPTTDISFDVIISF